MQKTHRQKKLNKKLNQEPRAEKHRQTEKSCIALLFLADMTLFRFI